MQLKLRHLILFIIACSVLICAGTPGGALLAVGTLMQLALLIYGLEISRKSQLGVLKLFLVSIPLFVFWGGIHSFVTIYLREKQFLFLTMSLTVLLALSFLISFQVVFSYFFLKDNNYELIATLQASFNSIKERRYYFLKITCGIFALSFMPWLSSDWKLVFALTVTHLSLNRAQLKKAVANF